MRVALVDGVKQEAVKGAKGVCPCCGKEVIAKCGVIRCPHWAHKNTEECNYSLKEPKTQWHLWWQNQFPKEWQEVKCVNEKGEVHIADIKTPMGMVVEFQHSAIAPEERLAREQFYKNMTWVVDGTRVKKDFECFVKNSKNLNRLPICVPQFPISWFTVNLADEILPPCWKLGENVPLYFDFRLAETAGTEDEPQKLREFIWGFFKKGPQVFAVAMPHDCFVYLIWKGAIRDFEDLVVRRSQNSNPHSRGCRSQGLSAGANPQEVNRAKTNNRSSRF